MPKGRLVEKPISQVGKSSDDEEDMGFPAHKFQEDQGSEIECMEHEEQDLVVLTSEDPQDHPPSSPLDVDKAEKETKFQSETG
jgi:hypothetical protein